MQRTETAENASFILYLLPIVASAAYALSAWVSEGLSSNLPVTIYFTVTKNPYLFLLGFTSVCLAVLIDVYGSPADSRLNKLTENYRQTQMLATVCLLSAAVFVWSAAEYSPSTGRFLQILLEGRYALIYPLTLFMLSMLLNPSINLGFLSLSRLLRNASVILLASSPIILYGLWRLQASWAVVLLLTFVALLSGLTLLFIRGLGRSS